MNVVMRNIMKDGSLYHYEAVTDLPAYSTSMEEAEEEVKDFLSVKNMLKFYPEEVFRNVRYNDNIVCKNIKIIQDFITDRYVIMFESIAFLHLPEYSIEE